MARGTAIVIDLDEVETPFSKIFSVKVTPQLLRAIDRAVKRYRFESRSAFTRYVFCKLLLGLGLLSPGEEHSCKAPLRGRDSLDDKIAEIAAELRGGKQ